MERGAVDYAIKVPVQALRFWGRMRVVMSCDQENAIAALGRAVAAVRGEETVAQVGPRHDSKSQGPIETAGGRVQQRIRTLVRAVDAHYEVEVKSGDPICTWLARRASWVLTRSSVKEDGSTLCRRTKGRDYHGQIAELAATGMRKLPARAAGMMVARRPDEKRWNKRLFGQIARPIRPGRDPPGGGDVLRPMYLTKAMVARLGRAPGCPACDETAKAVTVKRGQAESAQPAASDGHAPPAPAPAAASAAAPAQPARDDGADVEIAARPKRQVSGKEEAPESKRARTIGGLPACVAPLMTCAVDSGECAAEPVNDNSGAREDA
ncbi:unnamed protein product, partial [Prorocentrum cordatum]